MPWVPLDANFQDDEQILDLTAEAELVFLRALGLSMRRGSEGLIHRSHLRGLCDKFDMGPDARLEVAAELVGVGLWGALGDDEWLILSWESWRSPADSRDDLGRNDASDRGKLANHSRWKHEGEFRECRRCFPENPLVDPSESERSPNGVPAESDGDPFGSDPHPRIEERKGSDMTAPSKVSRSTKEDNPQPVDKPVGANGTKPWKQAWQDVTHAIQRHGAQTFLTATREAGELDPRTWSAANTARQAIRYSDETDAMYRFRDAYERTP